MWKNKKDETLMRKMYEKDKEEVQEIERKSVKPKINEKSERIVKKKNNMSAMKDRVNQENKEEFDLWPVNMEKNYFDN